MFCEYRPYEGKANYNMGIEALGIADESQIPCTPDLAEHIRFHGKAMVNPI